MWTGILHRIAVRSYLDGSRVHIISHSKLINFSQKTSDFWTHFGDVFLQKSRILTKIGTNGSANGRNEPRIGQNGAQRRRERLGMVPGLRKRRILRKIGRYSDPPSKGETKIITNRRTQILLKGAKRLVSSRFGRFSHRHWICGPNICTVPCIPAVRCSAPAGRPADRPSQAAARVAVSQFQQ